MRELLYRFSYALVWLWVWHNEMYRRSYWLYVAGQEWFWIHILHDPNEDKNNDRS